MPATTEHKSVKGLWWYIPFLLILVFCFPPDTFAQAKKKVVFIRYRIQPTHFTTVVEGFQDTMARRGYLEGANIEYVDIITRSADQSSVPDVIEAVRKYKDSADMFITCGWVSMFAQRELAGSGVPQLFVPVLESVALEMLTSINKPPGTNLSGLYLMYPPEKILRLTRLIIPDLKNYAYVYDSTIPADIVFKKAYENLNPANRHGITVHYIDLKEGIEKVLVQLKEKDIEAYGGIVGAFQKKDELARSTLPVITSFPLDIDQDSIGAYTEGGVTVAGLFNPFRYTGVQAAEMTADIFDGKNSIEETIPRPAMQLAFINLKNANRLSLPISFEALEVVDIVIK